MISRRQWILGALAAAQAWTAQTQGVKRMAKALSEASAPPWRPKGIIIESHIHLFAGDPARFPYNSGSYAPHPEPVEQYVKFAGEAHIDHAVIVHPEPYQDDHRYLEYSFAHEPSPGFFKGKASMSPWPTAARARSRSCRRRRRTS